MISIIFFKGKYRIEQSLQEYYDAFLASEKYMSIYKEAFIDDDSVSKEEFIKQFKKDYPGRLPKALRKMSKETKKGE